MILMLIHLSLNLTQTLGKAAYPLLANSSCVSINTTTPRESRVYGQVGLTHEEVASMSSGTWQFSFSVFGLTMHLLVSILSITPKYFGEKVGWGWG